MATGRMEARPLARTDAQRARTLVASVLGGTPYLDRTIELLDAAANGDPETRALVVELETTVACALYGAVAGASGAWELSMVVVAAPVARTGEVGRALIDGVIDDVRREGGRFVMAELPADAALGQSLTLLRTLAFKQEARIPDFYGDGVARLFLRRDL